jgi:tetraacyldisaccharide 4'-kinase
MHWLERHWYRRTPVSCALLPLAGLYRLAVTLRRAAYRRGVFHAVRLPVPVVIVGNITVGGTGKTPLTVWLARWLRQHGYVPGIVTRGYGGQSAVWPQYVQADSDPTQVGDEPVLLARAAGCAVVADPDRVRGARLLLERYGCNVVLSDDGLQHYRLARDVEIAVIDATRRFGNGWCLPAGPLREPVVRLNSVDVRLVNGDAGADEWSMRLTEQGLCRLGERTPSASVEHFRGRHVHAVAAIGNPRRFFDQLRDLGVEPIEHPFPDHHKFTPADLAFGDDTEIIMTEKDAVKCERLGVRGWYLRVSAQPDVRLGELVLRRVKEATDG